eukprot:527172-Pyramimonas_sp.AAC.1
MDMPARLVRVDRPAGIEACGMVLAHISFIRVISRKPKAHGVETFERRSPAGGLGALAPREVHHVQLSAALHGGTVLHLALGLHVERKEAVAARRVLVHLRLAHMPPLLYQCQWPRLSMLRSGTEFGCGEKGERGREIAIVQRGLVVTCG